MTITGSERHRHVSKLISPDRSTSDKMQAAANYCTETPRSIHMGKYARLPTSKAPNVGVTAPRDDASQSLQACDEIPGA